MSFLDNAAGIKDTRLAREVLEEISRVARGEVAHLVEVTIRIKRMNLTKYTEEPLIIPRHMLAHLYALAESYRKSLDVMHVDYVPGNSEYSARAYVKMDDLVVIEIVHRDHTPEHNDEDVRRRNLRGHGAQVDLSVFEQ